MPIHNKSIIVLARLLFICLLAILNACSDNLSQLERIKSRGTLRVALIATPPLYFPDESLIKGYDYEIIASYAQSIGAKLEIIRVNTIGEIIAQLKQGKAHIGIAGNSPDYPDENILGSTSYEESEWHVIGNRKNILPKSFDDITPSTVIVAKDSKPALVLSDIKPKHPSLYWLELPHGNNRQVLEQVNLNNFKLSIISADVYKYYRYLYPEIKIAFTLTKQYPSRWFTHKDEDISLSNSINGFINRQKQNGKLEQRYNTYYRHLNVFNYIDSSYYLRLIEERLPQYSPYFKVAAINNEFDERFLAAVSYQESHWDDKARSHTGVRGLMMLTQDTAKRVGVTDRLDPEQSIMGGAKYLNILKASLPERIQEPDRSWMSLAAYNVGLGHLEDARIITESLGDDPNLWIDVEKHLPKLSQKEWYKKTKYGYARGHEPVAFVRRIRRYYDILRLYQQEEILEKLDQPLKLEKVRITSPAL
tara:strand:- start:26724 stop:28154 length:1431 start_codon:yes stop_codon:yes gene_type:complete